MLGRKSNSTVSEESVKKKINNAKNITVKGSNLNLAADNSKTEQAIFNEIGLIEEEQGYVLDLTGNLSENSEVNIIFQLRSSPTATTSNDSANNDIYFVKSITNIYSKINCSGYSGDNIFIGADKGLYISNDDGKTFSKSSSGNITKINKIMNINNKMYYLTEKGLWSSSNIGTNISAVYGYDASDDNKCIDFKDGAYVFNKLYLAVQDPKTDQKSMYNSTSSALTSFEETTGFTDNETDCDGLLNFTYNGQSYLIASTYHTRQWILDKNGWSKKESGKDFGQYQNDNDNIIFADAGTYISQSSDGAQSWEDISFPSSITVEGKSIMFVNNGIFYIANVATSNNVWSSEIGDGSSYDFKKIYDSTNQISSISSISDNELIIGSGSASTTVFDYYYAE